MRGRFHPLHLSLSQCQCFVTNFKHSCIIFERTGGHKKAQSHQESYLQVPKENGVSKCESRKEHRTYLTAPRFVSSMEEVRIESA